MLEKFLERHPADRRLHCDSGAGALAIEHDRNRDCDQAAQVFVAVDADAASARFLDFPA